MKSAHGTNSDSAVMPHIDMKIKWIDNSQGVPLDELKRTRQEVEDVDDVQNIEMIAIKSYKSSDHSGWNGWQSIVSETEHGNAWVEKLTRIVGVWQCTTLCAQRRRVSVSRKIRSNKFARNEGLKVENEKSTLEPS